MAPRVTPDTSAAAREADEQLREAVRAARAADEQLTAKVLRARALGLSWAHIGRTLGITGQGAIKRYAGLDTLPLDI